MIVHCVAASRCTSSRVIANSYRCRLANKLIQAGKYATPHVIEESRVNTIETAATYKQCHMLPVSSVATLLWACVETATLWNVTAPRKYGQCLLPMVLPRVPEPPPCCPRRFARHFVASSLPAGKSRQDSQADTAPGACLPLGKHLGYSVLWAAVLHRK